MPEQDRRWSEQERQIFRFEDAAGQGRAADPLAVRRRLTNLLQDVGRVLEESRSTDDDVAERALRKLRIASCDVFGLGLPFDPATGEGVTDWTWLRILNAFCEWQEKNVWPAASGPSCSRPTDPSSPSETVPSTT